jgi:UDP-N-acetylmuramoyl-L-alanyl-D-glutamate--2,6-diaminopimelate ligase
MVSFNLALVKQRLRKPINVYHWLVGQFFVLLNGSPADGLTIIGVTGTDGKTTTGHLIYEFLKSAGIRVALISTIGGKIGRKKIDTGFHVTSPDAPQLQPLLKKIKKSGFTHVILETTSHGLDQNRFVGLKFEMAVFTNLTPEHLDYHLTLTNYRKAKMKLFKDVKYAILNRDDPSYTQFRSAAGKAKIIPYSKFSPENISPSLRGDYNLYNIAAARAVAKVYRVPDSVINTVCKTFLGIPGRRQEIKLGQDFRAIVDFAHTPNALTRMLKQLRHELPKGKKIILVFGCAGRRDSQKRPYMGQIAYRLADTIIVTAEDPRTESLDDIFTQITKKLPTNSVKIIREDSRRKAIILGARLAKTGDILVVTGKGHEKSLCLGKIESPWSDQKEVERAVKKQVKRAVN